MQDSKSCNYFCWCDAHAINQEHEKLKRVEEGMVDASGDLKELASGDLKEELENVKKELTAMKRALEVKDITRGLNKLTINVNFGSLDDKKD